MKTTVFVISGKSPITMPGGLGAYAFNSAKIVSSVFPNTHIISFSGSEEKVTLDDGIVLHHVTTPFNNLLGWGAF